MYLNWILGVNNMPKYRLILLYQTILHNEAALSEYLNSSRVLTNQIRQCWINERNFSHLRKNHKPRIHCIYGRENAWLWGNNVIEGSFSVDHWYTVRDTLAFIVEKLYLVEEWKWLEKGD